MRCFGVRVPSSLVLGARRVLQVCNAVRVVHMGLTTIAPVVITRLGQALEADHVATWVRLLVHFQRIGREHFKRSTADSRRRASEAAIHHRIVETKRLKDLGTFVRLEC